MDYDRYSTLSSDGGNKKVVTTKSTTVMPYDPSSGVLPPPGTQEEWTTTKRRINHKTKQVETRVQRQIIMEDGKVIADSGPTVTTKTTEDAKSDESEDTKHRRLGDSEVPEKYRKDIGNQVVSEKTVTHNVMREAKEENYQYHDESLRELEGKDVHRKAVEAPHELIRIENELPQVPRGKLVHFSSKGRKVNDVDEIQEVSRLDKDGLLKTDTTQTQHHEEYEDDEVPEETRESQKHLTESTSRKQLEYNRPGYDYDDNRTSRTNSSMSVSRNDKVKSKKWRDHKADSGDDSDVVETSEVYRLSDKMRSLKTSAKNPSKSSKGKSRKDDASTQASLSDSDDEGRRHRHGGKHLHEVHERVESRKSTFGTPAGHDKCCDPLESKPRNKYYYGSDQVENGDADKGYISSNVKTSKFAMENNRVIEDKSFNEDFERTFKGQNEQRDVQRDYDRFVQRTKEHTKGIRDRSMSPMLPPPGPPEYIHRPVKTNEYLSSSLDKPARSRSFYDHQVHEYESHKQSHKGSSVKDAGYGSLPSKADREPYRAISPSPVSRGTWTKSSSNQQYSNDYTSSSNRRPTYSRSNSRTDFPDFAPLNSPLEIKSLTENAMKSRHISTYN